MTDAELPVKAQQLSEDTQTRLKARVLFLKGNSPVEISRQMGIPVRTVREWVTSERWGRARKSLLREVNAKVLKAIQRDYAHVVNAQFGQMRLLKERLWREITGVNPQDGHTPQPALVVGDGEAAIGLLIKLLQVENNFITGTLEMISEVTPKLNPEDLRVAGLDNDNDGLDNGNEENP